MAHRDMPRGFSTMSKHEETRAPSRARARGCYDKSRHIQTSSRVYARRPAGTKINRNAHPNARTRRGANLTKHDKTRHAYARTREARCIEDRQQNGCETATVMRATRARCEQREQASAHKKTHALSSSRGLAASLVHSWHHASRVIRVLPCPRLWRAGQRT